MLNIDHTVITNVPCIFDKKYIFFFILMKEKVPPIIVG